MNDQTSKPIQLVYLIGTYPELTNTFIDREIATLRQLGDFQIRIVSIRHPHTIDSCSSEQKAFFKETQYLLPPKWSGFNLIGFLMANFFFLFSLPLVYFKTLFYLLSRSQRNIKAKMITIVYFWQGVYAAHLLRRTPFDHLHVHFMDRAVVVAFVVGRFLGKSYSFTAHAADIYTRAALVREKIDNAQFVITVSQYNKQHLLETYPGINPDKIHILHPWVDGSLFSPSGDRQVHDCFHILSVGRLVEKKGHVDLVEAVHLLCEKGINAECQIVGDGPLHAELAERIAKHELQPHVRLLGGLPQGQVMDLLRNWGDVFVLPCVIAQNGDRDGIPVSLAEAMAMELPVVSTDIIGIGELVQPGTGILVPPHDPAALAEALYTIAIQEKQVTARMGRKGREVVDKEFNLLKGTQDLAGYFRQAVGKDGDEMTRTEDLFSEPGTLINTRYVVISPVKDEGAYIETTICSMVEQTIRPTVWIIVNDGSKDATEEIVQKYALEHSWIRLVNRQDSGVRKRGKGVVEAFYSGYEILTEPYDFIVKLDGDVSFGPNYFESLMNKFANDPLLGIAGGGLYERPDEKTWVLYTTKDHVRGCTKVYRRECFDAIEGLVASMGWDGIDEWKALAKGWRVQSFLPLKIYHYRFTGAATGYLKSCIEQGYGAYRMGYHPLFMIARGIRRMTDRPYLVGGIAMIGAYMMAGLRKQELLADPSVVRYIRRSQMEKLSGLFSGKPIHEG